MRRHVALALTILIATSGLSTEALANDRLAKRLHRSFGIVRQEVHKYLSYILVKVWKPKVEALRAEKLAPKTLLARVDAMTDEVVHLLLPQGKRLMRDVIFGTRSTHLRIAMPGLRQAAQTAMGKAIADGSFRPMTRGSVERMASRPERELNDRLERALLEELEDYVQRELEGAVGLPVRGRPRASLRPLPTRYAGSYLEAARREVLRFDFWWLRKRRRLWLTHMATTRSREEIDRARHRGPVWRLISGVSQEAWAQNRLRIDFKWGRFNWEIDRRRIRRRMDQDLAHGAWALTRLVKELLAPETVRRLEERLGRRVREELSSSPLREQAERYPRTSRTLQKALRRLEEELSPIMNRAMDRVPLPEPLRELAREHGRRFMREELEETLHRSIQREAAPHAAARRVREKLGGWVSDALVRFDPGGLDPGQVRLRARRFVQKQVGPVLREEIAESLRASGLDLHFGNRKASAKAVEAVVDRFAVDKLIEREVDKQLRPAGSQGADDV